MTFWEVNHREHAIGKVSIPCTIDQLSEMVAGLVKFANTHEKIANRIVRVSIGRDTVIFKLGLEE